jgi:hypothetical protein
MPLSWNEIKDRASHYGNEKIQTGNKLRVYPNPARQFVIVDYALNRTTIIPGTWRLTVTCLDIGRPLAVKSIAYPTGQALFDTREYTRGGYLVILTEGEQIIETATFVIQP